MALANTHRLVWIRSLKQSRVSRLGQLLGFARATSDGAFNATIWYVGGGAALTLAGIGRGRIFLGHGLNDQRTGCGVHEQ